MKTPFILPILGDAIREAPCARTEEGLLVQIVFETFTVKSDIADLAKLIECVNPVNALAKADQCNSEPKAVTKRDQVDRFVGWRLPERSSSSMLLTLDRVHVPSPLRKTRVVWSARSVGTRLRIVGPDHCLVHMIDSDQS